MEKLVGEGVGFERIRRVTGYLSGDVKRFNNGKRAEEKDRVKHSGIKEITKSCECECECKNEN
ncbi:MAG: hypothetical protein IJR82_03490 [Bacilli bacterium]|nr:hypothetical protein [Bacilli bacterium]